MRQNREPRKRATYTCHLNYDKEDMVQWGRGRSSQSIGAESLG